MSKTTPLSEVLKGTQEVTSLGTTDRVLAFDAFGNPKKISRNSLVRSVLGAISFVGEQWIRIGWCSSMGSAFFSVSTVWSSNPGVHLLIDVICHPNSPNYNSVAVLSRLQHAKTATIDKVRVVCKTGNPVYVDLHFNSTTTHSLYVELIAGRSFVLLSDFEADAQIPEGFSSKEFDLSKTSWG